MRENRISGAAAASQGEPIVQPYDVPLRLLHPSGSPAFPVQATVSICICVCICIIAQPDSSFPYASVLSVRESERLSLSSVMNVKSFG